MDMISLASKKVKRMLSPRFIRFIHFNPIFSLANSHIYLNLMLFNPKKH
jgi:hypothetical protein